jgi:hypothetical protein
MKILQDLQAQGSAIEKQFQEAQAAYQPEADAAVAAEQEVAKWEAAVAFHSQLTALQQQRGEAQNSLTEKEEAYAAKLEEMEAAKKAAADAEAALNALQQQINTLRETE